MNIFAVGNPFVFFVYMAYTLPWIVLGFYLYPIKILVRISAILTAALCIIGITFVILWYFDKFVQHVKDCLISSENSDSEQNNNIRLEEESTEDEETQLLNNKDLSEETEQKKVGNEAQPSEKKNTAKDKKLCSGELICSILSAAAKWVAGVFVLLCFGFIGYLLHHIIFVLTNDEEQAVIELLHTLPLIVIPLSAFIIRYLMQLNEKTSNAKNTTLPNPKELSENGKKPVSEERKNGSQHVSNIESEDRG